MIKNILFPLTVLVLFSCKVKKQESFSKNKQKPFSFVQLCDTQLGLGGYKNDIKSFKTAVKQINTLNPDFVVICGDLVQKRKDSSFIDFKKINETFKMPSYIAPGNHDVGVNPNKKTLNYYRKTIGDDYYTFQHKGYSFVVTNSLFWKTNVEYESKKHDNWFKERLKENSINNVPVFVIGHYPLYLKTLDEEEIFGNLPLTKRKELLDLFKKNNVVAYLTGHAHRRIINKQDNIQLVTAVSTSKNSRNSPLGFRVWNVSLDIITHHFVPLQP
jgi:predicted phosphodiesterase